MIAGSDETATYSVFFEYSKSGNTAIWLGMSSIFFFFGFIGTLHAARAELLPGQGGSGQGG